MFETAMARSYLTSLQLSLAESTIEGKTLDQSPTETGSGFILLLTDGWWD